MKFIKKIKTTEHSKDLKGTGIPKGTILYVIKEGPVAPFGEHHKVLVVRVDNGTGYLSLMPETAIRDTEVPFIELENKSQNLNNIKE